jgi:hypothetical protein
VKRLLLNASIFALFLSLAAPAVSAVKAGTTCQKMGQISIYKGKEYTCVKSGKKLIWNAGIKVKIASPQMSPTPISTPAPTPKASQFPPLAPNPFQTPFPNEFTRDQMVSAALINLDSYIATYSSIKSYKLIVGPEFNSNLVEISSYVQKSYSALPFPAGYKKTIVVITNNRDFGEREISDFGIDRSDANNAVGGPCMNCAGEGWSISDNGLGPVVPHEIFHVWQKSAYQRKGNNNPDPNNPLNPPVWFDEGSAEFFGYGLYRERVKFYEGVGAYPTSRNLQSLKSYSTRNLDPALPYLLGRIASEYIVASVGMERFMQIFFNVGAGQDFPQAFEKATGIALNLFYEKFDKNIKNMF